MTSSYARAVALTGWIDENITIPQVLDLIGWDTTYEGGRLDCPVCDGDDCMRMHLTWAFCFGDWKAYRPSSLYAEFRHMPAGKAAQRMIRELGITMTDDILFAAKPAPPAHVCALPCKGGLTVQLGPLMDAPPWNDHTALVISRLMDLLDLVCTPADAQKWLDMAREACKRLSATYGVKSDG